MRYFTSASLMPNFGVLRAELIFTQKRVKHFKRADAARRSKLGDGLSGGLRHSGGIGDEQLIQPAGNGASPSAAPTLSRRSGGKALKLRVVRKRFKKLLRLKLCKLLRQSGDEHGGAGGIGIDVVRGGDAGLMQHTSCLAHLAEVLSRPWPYGGRR